jgi:hypothetical protein
VSAAHTLPKAYKLFTPRGESFTFCLEGLKLYSAYNWTPSGSYKYLHRKLPGNKNVLFHRVLLGVSWPYLVDHINRDPTDNRLANLRKADRRQNSGNTTKRPGSATSKYKGVRLRAGTTCCWQCRVGGKHLGSYKTEREAALTYNEGAKKHFGEFAILNDVEESVMHEARRENAKRGDL